MQEIVHPKGKVYYTMGEVSEMFDVKPSLLRYWEQEFDIIKPNRNKKGNRLYKPQDVDNIKIIYHLLKERKMKIEVARRYMKENPSGADRDTEIMEKLLSIRGLLVEIKNDLTYNGEIVDDDAVEVVVVKKNPRKALKKDAPAVSPQKNENKTVPDGLFPEEREAAEIPDDKPPFEEQPLFELVPPQDFATVDEAMDAFITKHYDEEGDEDKPESDPFAVFVEEEVVSVKPADNKDGKDKRPVIIEQTLF